MNVSKESLCLTFVGKLFHTAAAEWLNDQLDATSLVAVVASISCDDGRRVRVGTYAGRHGVRYSDIPVCRIVNTSVASLMDTRGRTGSQWSSLKTDVSWSRLVSFGHNTSQRVRYALQFVKVALRHSSQDRVAKVQARSDDTAGDSPNHVIRKRRSDVEKAGITDRRDVIVERQTLADGDTETLNEVHQFD